jgi:hypothetical protein
MIINLKKGEEDVCVSGCGVEKAKKGKNRGVGLRRDK